MQQPADNTLLALLLTAYNKEVQDFYYFPEVVLIGRQRIDPELFYGLLQHGYLELVRHDRFGRYFRLSATAQALLLATLSAQRRKGRKKNSPATATPQRFRPQQLDLPTEPPARGL